MNTLVKAKNALNKKTEAPAPVVESVIMYRLYNPNATGAGPHHCTTDKNEYNTLSSYGWKQEGIGWHGMK